MGELTRGSFLGTVAAVAMSTVASKAAPVEPLRGLPVADIVGPWSTVPRGAPIYRRDDSATILELR